MRNSIIALLILLSTGAFSQQFNNEWIDFSKTYFKFKIAEKGIYRLSHATLNGAGLGNTPAQQFKLFRNGEEIAIYTSEANGPLAATGYIEFWGEPNDGKADKLLYRDPNSQHSDKISLQTDTAVYFLTTNPGLNLRLTDISNNVANNPLTAEPFFIYDRYLF